MKFKLHSLCHALHLSSHFSSSVLFSRSSVVFLCPIHSAYKTASKTASLQSQLSPPPNLTSLTNPITCIRPVFTLVFYINRMLIKVFHSIDHKTRLTKSLETSSSITVPFSAGKHRNLQQNSFCFPPAAVLSSTVRRRGIGFTWFQ